MTPSNHNFMIKPKTPSIIESRFTIQYRSCHNIHNRTPFGILKVFPCELWKKRKPNLNYLIVWGYLVFYRVSDSKMMKLGSRALKSNFVGYAENLKALEYWIRFQT